MAEYKAIKDFNKSGLEVKEGDSIDLELEDAMDLPVVLAADYVPKKKEPEKKAAAKKPAKKEV